MPAKPKKKTPAPKPSVRDSAASVASGQAVKVDRPSRYDPAIQPSMFGRPTRYDPAYCEQLVEYFETEAADRSPIMLTVATSDKGNSYKPIPKPLPTLERFANRLKVTMATLGNWQNDHSDFLAAVTRAKQIQKDIISSEGWQGLVPPATLAFIASNFTDMRMKAEQPVATSTTNTTTINVLCELSDNVRMEIRKALEGKSKEPLVIEGKAEES